MNPNAPKEGKRRADAIHEQIEGLKSGVPPRSPALESPAAFVHRRMKELAEKEKKQNEMR